MMKKTCLLLSSLLTLPVSSLASEIPDKDQLDKLLQVKIRSVKTIALNPTLVEAVRSQNDEGLTVEVIRQRDKEWRQENRLTSFKYGLQINEAGKLLKSYVDHNPAFSEAVLTDNQGANVAAYPVTSDYWQGDEEQWTTAFNKGDGKIHMGAIERNPSTDVDAVKLASPVLDEEGGTIGVLVVGVTLDYLKERSETRQ
jgi:hypothetical protein